jgi:hypothetical protein
LDSAAWARSGLRSSRFGHQKSLVVASIPAFTGPVNSIWEVAIANAPSSAADFPRFMFISVVLKQWHIKFQQMSITG